jgi:hypothetical protein
MPARSSAGASESVGGSLMMVNWRLQNMGFSASNWHPGTYGANTSVGLDCDKSLPEVQIRIPGADRVRSPWDMGIQRQYLSCLMHLSPIISLQKLSCAQSLTRSWN